MSSPQTTYSHNKSANSTPTTLDQVRGVYQHAIEYTTLPRSIRGIGILWALATFAGCMFMCWLFGPETIRIWHRDGIENWPRLLLLSFGFLSFFIFGTAFLIYVARLEFFGPQDLPILFDRKRRKVYRLELVQPAGKLGFFKLWSITQTEYEWDSIVPEYHVETTTTGSTVKQYHSLLLKVPHTPACLEQVKIRDVYPETKDLWIKFFLWIFTTNFLMRKR